MNASVVSDAKNLPVEFGPAQNVIWRTALPPGHSSPVLTADRIFVTAFDANKLYVITLDRANGKIFEATKLLDEADGQQTRAGILTVAHASPDRNSSAANRHKH